MTETKSQACEHGKSGLLPSLMFDIGFGLRNSKIVDLNLEIEGRSLIRLSRLFHCDIQKGKKLTENIQCDIGFDIGVLF